MGTASQTGANRVPVRAWLVAFLALLAFTMLVARASPSGPLRPGPRAAAVSDSSYWYYCPPGLVDTGSADGQANGETCAFWLLKSFPLGGNRQPHLNQTLVPGLDVLPAWQRTRGAGVTVAVIDTGVDPSSADLAPNLLQGWNFYDGNGDTSDGAGHGTVIASIIAAAAGNGGFVGIAPNAKILPIKVMGGPGGDSWSDQAVVQGIEYALQRGAKVLNLSLGGLDAPIPGIAGALADARKAGALVVIAAGNDGANLDGGTHTEFPDGYGLPNTLTVADFTNRNALADDSNYGTRHVQIASLGADLWGDYPSSANGGYLGGSSAAAATVSGVAALLFAADPQATAAQVRRAIIVGANRNVPQLQGKVEANGLLSASGALRALTQPDTGAPSPFRASGPAATFRLRRTIRLRFAWSPAHDPELEGYQFTLDGQTSTLATATTTFVAAMPPGLHHWSIAAYDLAGNRMEAERRRGEGSP
jgi:subtilisin family serine protease